MSRTPNIGVVGVKYWAYMAKVMAECLNQVIEGKETKIPIGVLGDAQLFFKVVLKQKTGTHFDNLLAQTNALVIALEILNDYLFFQSQTFREANRQFRRFAELLKYLEDRPTVSLGIGKGWAKQPAIPLNRENQKRAVDLRDFFAALLRKDAREGRD